MSYRVLLDELADFGYPEEAGVRSEIAQWVARKVTQAIAAERERCAAIAEHWAQHHAFYDGPREACKRVARSIREGKDPSQLSLDPPNW